MPREIVRFTHSHHRFAVTSHARPDGDSIGSQLAWAMALKNLGKEVMVVNADPCPRPYTELPGSYKIQVAPHLEGSYDGVFVLECNDLARTGVGNLDRYTIINIDHHPKTQPFGDLNWLDSSAAAVGEMIYRLIQKLDLALNAEMASNLYAAILTDTGSFQFSNTRAETFTIVSDLVAAGADPGQLAQLIYQSQPLGKVKLLARLLSGLQLDPSQSIAWITLTRQMLAETGTSLQDTESLVNHPLSIDGVALVAFFREEGTGRYRVSLRSKGEVDVGEVAARFGGGGHQNAAGLSVEGTLEEVEQRVVSELRRLIG